MHSSPPDASRIQSTLLQTFRTLPLDQAQAIERRLHGAADLEAAIAQAGHDGPDDALTALLAYREALAELDDPARLAARLITQADAADRRADAHAEEAAEFFGRAAYRGGRGDTDLAAQFHARAQAAETTAAALRDTAFTDGLRAARTLARVGMAADLRAIA